MNESSLEGRLHRRTYAEIDTRKVRSNYLLLRDLLPQGSFFCPMIKANAYGHGDVEISRVLRASGATYLGVCLLEEGIGLRRAGDQGALLVFGIYDDWSADALLEFNLTPVISQWHQLESLDRALTAKDLHRFPIHIKFNTGMNRLGFEVGEARGLRAWLNSHPRIRLEGVCTHLLRGDDAGVPGGESESQLMAFAEALIPFQGLDFHAHALNSSATATLWKRVLDQKNLGAGGVWPLGSRPGIGLYGIQPSSDEDVNLNLKPVLAFKSHLVSLRGLRVGERLSYNATWRAKRESRIGVVPVGYADGYFRSLSNRASVLCRGMRAPVAGTICMDYFMVDLTEVEARTGEIQVGEEIVLIGEQGSERIYAAELADLVGTIPYEILTSVSSRVPRVYV